MDTRGGRRPALILIGIILLIAQLTVSIRNRAALADKTGDPWDGRSLEWATASPPPAFNFAVLPNVSGEDAYWGIKQRARRQTGDTEPPRYHDVEMPRNSPTGFICAFFATVNTNNVMALAFGVLIVVLLMGGSLWILANLNHNMMPMDQLTRMQR
jgi:heme/copper-type cytochrome/quinol oxidase subunit 1